MSQDIKINRLDPNTFEYQTYTSTDENLIASSNLDTVFSSITDYIEYYIYDQNQTLIYPLDTLPLIKYDIREGDVLLNPPSDLQSVGFDVGLYNILYSFYRKRLSSSLSEKYFISEISSDRTEIRLDSNTIANELIISSTNDFIDYRETADYFVDFYLNFGSNQTVIANNVKLETDENLDPTVLIKLYEPLPINFNLKDELWVVEMLSDPQAYEVDFPFEPEVEQDFTYIQGPNYSLDIVNQTATSEEQFSYSTLIESDITSSINQIQNLLNKKEINININYENYNNFINFSSAKTRLENFYYKVELIESYTNELNTLSSQVTSDTQFSLAYSSSTAQLTSKIDDIIKNFDGYEYFLYFNSGSQYSYPKQNSTPPFQLYSSNSVEAKTWLGNATPDTLYYGGQALSASNYDQNNRDWLYWSIPEYLREDPSNQKYELFVDMVGQYYDNVWVYTKDLTNRFNADNRLDYGISKDLVADAIRDFAIKLYSNNFNTDDLFTAFLGLTPSGSAFPFPNITGSLPTPTGYEYVDTKISSSNDIVPQDDVNKSIYKRIYHNIPYLLKTKGTIAGIRALITSYGIPDTILRISEFGGKDRNEAQDYDLKQNVFNYAFNTGPDGQQYISSSFSANSKFPNDGNSTPRNIQFRIKPQEIPQPTNNIPSSNIVYSQSLFHAVDNSNVMGPVVVLEYTGSGFVTGSYSGSIASPYDTYGTLKFIPADSDVSELSASVYLPFFNGDWWSIQASVDVSTATATLFAANQINGKVGFKASSSVSGFDTAYYTDSEKAYLNYENQVQLQNSVIYNPFSGSFQEYRFWNQPISESKFFDYTVNPYSVEGNNINSTPNELIFRAALGSQLSRDSTTPAIPTNIAPTSIHPRVTGSAVQITQSFSDGTSDYFTSFPSSKNKRLYVENKEFIYQDQVPSGIKNRITDKVHKQNLVLAEAPYGISGSTAVISSENNNTTTISSLKSIQTTSYVSQSYTPSINYLEVGFSPSNQINDDINAQIGYFNIGEYIGDPRFISSSAKSYPDLDRLRDAYFEKYMASYDVRDFIRLIKFFDNSLFKMIKDFTPARTSLSSGVIVKQHLLERNRQRQALASSSLHNYEGLVVNLPKNYSSGSSDFPQYSTSGSSIYKFSGGPGGVMNKYNGIKTSPSASAYGLTNIFGPLTQSYEETLSGPLGQETVTIFNQDEFYNGEFSGSNILVQDGNLNPGCDIYKDPSSKPISFKPIFYNNNINQQGISTLDSFNNINNFPRQGFAWFYSELNQGSQINSSMKYIKLAARDIDGNSIGDFIESTNTLDVVFTDISLPGGRTATEYSINNSINNGTHVLIEVDTSQGDFNITASAQGGSEKWMLETSGSFTSSFDGTLSQANLRAQNSFIDNTAEFQRQYLWFWGDQDGTANIPKQPANLSFFNPGSSTKPAINLLNDNNFISGSYTLGRTPNVPLYFSASLFYSSSRFDVGTVITKENQLVHSGSYPFQSPSQNFTLAPLTTLSGEFIPSPITVDVDPLFFTDATSIDQSLRGDQRNNLIAGSSQIVQAGTATIDFHFPQITFLSGAQKSNPPKTFITPFSGSNHTIDGTTNQNFGGTESTIAGVGYTDNAENGEVQWKWTNYSQAGSPPSGYDVLNYMKIAFSYTFVMPNPPNNSYNISEIGVQWFADDGYTETIKEIVSRPDIFPYVQYDNLLVGGGGRNSPPTNITLTSTNNTIIVSGDLFWGSQDSGGNNANTSTNASTYPADPNYQVQEQMRLIPYFKSSELESLFPEYYIQDFSVEVEALSLWNGNYNTTTSYTPYFPYYNGPFPTAPQIDVNFSFSPSTQPLRNGTQGNSSNLSKLLPFTNRAVLATGGNTITASVDLMYTSSTRDDIITSSLDVYHTLPVDTTLFPGTQFFGDTITFPDSPILNINDPTTPDGTDNTSGSTVNEVDGMYYLRFNFDNLKFGTAPTTNALSNQFDFDSTFDPIFNPAEPAGNTKILLDQDVEDASGGIDQITASFFIEKGNTSDTSTFGGDSNRFYLAQPFLQTGDTTATGRINFDGQLPEFLPTSISTVLNINDTLRFGIEVEKSFTFGLVVTSYSMSIFPSSSRWASYVGLPSYNDPNSNFDSPDATDVIIPSFYGEGVLPFQYAKDCQPLLNNYNLQRQSTFLMDVDYNTQSGPVIPVNQAQILSGSAIKAAVPDSNYSQLKSILPRYVGSKSTSQELNIWNVGDTGTFGKLPTIELRDAFFGYFNDIDDPYPNINGLTRINLNYLIDEQGNALPPSLEPLAIDTLKAVFPNTTIGKIAAKSGKTQYKELGEPAPIQRLMQYVTPVMYSQISAHNYVNEIPLSGSGYISQYDNGDENDVLFLRFNALGPASVSTSPVQSVDYYLDPEDDVTFSSLNDEDPYVVQTATNCKRVTSYAAASITPPIVADQDLASSQIISLQTSFVTSFVSETNRTRDELSFELHMYTRGTTSGAGIYTGTSEKPFNLEDIQCKVYTDDGRVTNIGSVMDYGWFEITNIVNYYKVKRRQTFRSFFRRWRFKRWVYTRVPVPTGGIKCTADWEMYETLYDLGLMRERKSKGGAGVTALEWIINANSGKHIIKGNDKISWRIKGSFKNARGGYRQGLFFPLGFDGAYTSVNIQGQGANDYLMNETNNASAPFWVYTGSSGGRTVVLDESILVMSSSNMNEAYGTTFRQADLEYQPGESEYFPFGKEPSYTSFDRIDSTVELKENDEIRFANNENFTYRVIRVYSPQENIESDPSVTGKKGRLKVQLDRPVDRSINKDFFLVRRPIVNPNSLYLNTPFPYESLSSASLTTTVRNTGSAALTQSAIVGPADTEGFYTASMLNIETATTPGILYPDFPTQYLVESASIIVNDLISKGIIES